MPRESKMPGENVKAIDNVYFHLSSELKWAHNIEEGQSGFKFQTQALPQKKTFPWKKRREHQVHGSLERVVKVLLQVSKILPCLALLLNSSYTLSLLQTSLFTSIQVIITTNNKSISTAFKELCFFTTFKDCKLHNKYRETLKTLIHLNA